MEFSLPYIADLIVQYGYFVLFPIVVVEGPIITVIAGFLSSLEYLNPVVVYCVALAGNFVGDTLFYALGRWGRGSLIARWGKYVGVTPVRLEHMEGYFIRHGGKTLLLGKWSQALGAPILAGAGAARMPYARFMAFNVVGEVPKTLLFLLIGYYFGRSYVSIDKYLNYFSVGIILLAAVIVAVYVITKRLSKDKDEK